MARVTITIFDVADAKDGQFQMDVDYFEGGFDPDSHAHKFSAILLRAADQLAANLGMPEEAATLGELAGADKVLQSQLASAQA